MTRYHFESDKHQNITQHKWTTSQKSIKMGPKARHGVDAFNPSTWKAGQANIKPVLGQAKPHKDTPVLGGEGSKKK